MSDDIVFIGRKAWIAYFWVVVFVVVAVFITGLVSDASSADSDQIPTWFFVVTAAIVLLGLLKWKSLRSVRWIVTDDTLITESGFLPWTKSKWVYGAGIYDVGYDIGFFMTIFRYSTISFRTTHGTTQTISEPYMKNVKRLMEEISALVIKLKDVEASGIAPQKSAVDELKELSALRASGDLSDEEFETMKSQVLRDRAGSR